MNKDQLTSAIDTLVDLSKNAEDPGIRLQAAQSILSYSHINTDAAGNGQAPSLPPSGAAGIQPPSLPGVDPEMASGPGNTDEPSEPTKKAAKKTSSKKKKG